MIRRLLPISLLLVAIAASVTSTPLAADASMSKATATEQQLEERVAELERDVARFDETSAGAGLALFLTAVFCALWAQNTGRSSWLWFFLGLFFHVITLVVSLVKNGGEARAGLRGFER